MTAPQFKIMTGLNDKVVLAQVPEGQIYLGELDGTYLNGSDTAEIRFRPLKVVMCSADKKPLEGEDK